MTISIGAEKAFYKTQHLARYKQKSFLNLINNTYKKSTANTIFVPILLEVVSSELGMRKRKNIKL